MRGALKKIRSSSTSLTLDLERVLAHAFEDDDSEDCSQPIAKRFWPGYFLQTCSIVRDQADALARTSEFQRHHSQILNPLSEFRIKDAKALVTGRSIHVLATMRVCPLQRLVDNANQGHAPTEICDRCRRDMPCMRSNDCSMKACDRAGPKGSMRANSRHSPKYREQNCCSVTIAVHSNTQEPRLVCPSRLSARSGISWLRPLSARCRFTLRLARTKCRSRKLSGAESSALSESQEHPLVLPHVSHFRHVPFRTIVKLKHSVHETPS